MNTISSVMTRKIELLISGFSKKQHVNNNAGKSNAELTDNVQISDEAWKLYQREILPEKNWNH